MTDWILSVTYLSGTNYGGIVTTAYTARGQVASVTDELGHMTTYLHDAGAWDPTSVVDALGHATQMTYDGEGRLLSNTDALGHTSSRTYLGPDLATTTDPLGNVTEYQHDEAGHLIAVSNPLSAKTSYSYDGWDRLLSQSDALSESVNYLYDSRGNLARTTDPNGKATGYLFDSMNRQVLRQDPLGRDAGISYATNGLPQHIFDRNGNERIMTYDARNRLQEVDFHRPDAGLESSIVYTYDLADRLTQVVDSLAGTITRSYDGRDNLLTETTPLGNVTYTYDLAGRRTSMTVGGQPEVTYGYDAANRLTSITKGTDVITLGYDNANRRTSMAMADGISVAYGYDNANRLISVTYTSGANTVGTLAYGYDAAGHLIAKGGTLATVTLPTPVVSATYNADNQLTLWGSQGFTYDFNGNMTSDGTMSYQWNARNQLVSLDGGQIAKFTYDAFGRRQSRVIAGTDTEYLYDISGNIGAEYVQDGGLPIDAGSLLSLDLSTFSPDELICTYRGGTFDTLADINGSILGLVSDGGIIQASYSYEPYGNTTYVGDAGTDQQYAARENDGAGLYYNRWRYYLPVQGRFISEDPTGMAGSGPNLYSYSGDDPVLYSDPSGEKGGWTLQNCSFGEAPSNTCESGWQVDESCARVWCDFYVNAKGGETYFGCNYSSTSQGGAPPAQQVFFNEGCIPKNRCPTHEPV